ncbi:MAG: hypothetical protein JJE49_09580 [Peptostreptococcaceae bacterium]|nr:hypothetical protein [Peptostreptococcaceae bacterium]
MFNKPGDYHNGGIWPFICGFYVAAPVAAKRYTLAMEKLFYLCNTAEGLDMNIVSFWHTQPELAT